MKLREKIYYPKSQIITGLYTSGSEYATKDNIEYIGSYHTYINGAIYSEAVYVKDKSFPLKPIEYDSTKAEFKYTDLTEGKFRIDTPININLFLNKHYIPTDDDKEKGYYVRYFIKRRNTSEFIETDNSSYMELNENEKFLFFYTTFSIDWRFLGNMYDLIRNDIIIAKGYKDENNRNVDILDITYKGFKSWINKEITFISIKDNEKVIYDQTFDSYGVGANDSIISIGSNDTDNITPAPVPPTNTGIITEDGIYITTEKDLILVI
jgi:hypothetical protein